ncbi:trypsin-like peptidase domain-containing protein [Gordonia hankookensis]|uniref:Serine protease n=1 Tax=Gordonia hankookensis TaxID=589403 RepID=A0ABR7W653_9ACTN|nr:trypsin-like peptidase domain-containing protein [Gordonia hankookensis]MBD1318309.1 serine protease [Gordonia hankookensis]NDZ93845.1 trypsin-like peptidase domain-containing protein [Streptomyces sp. SID11726]NEB25505.1 trypsin-like peptidase domain-containing protein [Streptomyces sp. SID6673]
MMRKLTALLAVLAATVLAGWGAGIAHAAPAKVYLGGGSGILVLKGGSSAAACTLTTIGKSNTGKLIGITAGHCGKPGQKVYSETFQDRGQAGTITYSASDLDIAVIEFNPAKVVPLRTVRGVTIRSVDTRPLAFPTIACKEGRTTGNTCGISWFSDGDAHFSQMCVIEGDSGSPVVVGDRLVGMVNAYYFVGCIGPETGTNIGPVLKRIGSLPQYRGYRPI